MIDNCLGRSDPLYEIVLKPAPHCNLNCEYCYDKSYNAEKINVKKIVSMGDDVFEGIVRLIEFAGSDNPSMGFLGGEATLLGTDYFRHFEDYFETVPHRSHIQSNMTLLGDEFCTFLKKYKYTIGASLDGTPAVHNATRDNSFTKSLRGILLAKEYGVLDKILCTITNTSVAYIEEIFELFALIKSPVHFNAGSPALIPSNYHTAMQKLFEMWYDFGMPFHGIQFYPLVESLNNRSWVDGANPVVGGCMRNAIQIDWVGDVTICAQLAGHPEYQLGNLLTDSPSSILNNANRARFFQHTKDIRSRCKTCMYRWICVGGCLFNAISNDLHYDPYCNGGAGMYRSAIERTGITFKEYTEMIPE